MIEIKYKTKKQKLCWSYLVLGLQSQRYASLHQEPYSTNLIAWNIRKRTALVQESANLFVCSGINFLKFVIHRH